MSELSLQLRALVVLASVVPKYVSGVHALGSAMRLRYSRRHRRLMYAPRMIFPMDNLLHVCVRAMTLPSNDLMPPDNFFFEIMNGWRST